MTFSTNGITADIIRDVMPPYQLSTDLLTAMLAAVPPPPSGATAVWRQQRCARLVHEVAGLMPANAPQARICAEIVIVHEAIEDTLARGERTRADSGSGVPAAADRVLAAGFGCDAGEVAGAPSAKAGAVLRHRTGRWDRCRGAGRGVG